MVVDYVSSVLFRRVDVFSRGSHFVFGNLLCLLDYPNKNTEQSTVLPFYIHFAHKLSFLIQRVKNCSSGLRNRLIRVEDD